MGAPAEQRVGKNLLFVLVLPYVGPALGAGIPLGYAPEFLTHSGSHFGMIDDEKAEECPVKCFAVVNMTQAEKARLIKAPNVPQPPKCTYADRKSTVYAIVYLAVPSALSVLRTSRLPRKGPTHRYDSFHRASGLHECARLLGW